MIYGENFFSCISMILHYFKQSEIDIHCRAALEHDFYKLLCVQQFLFIYKGTKIIRFQGVPRAINTGNVFSAGVYVYF